MFLWLLHACHLIPVPVVLHLPGQEAGQHNSSHLEDDHHGKRRSNSRNTSLQQEGVAALGHLWQEVCSWIWAGSQGGGGGHVQGGAEAARWRHLQ
jgi:hypothetical protein